MFSQRDIHQYVFQEWEHCYCIFSKKYDVREINECIFFQKEVQTTLEFICIQVDAH